MADPGLDQRIAQAYGRLSPSLRVASDYVARHPMEVATRGLRANSQASGVSPATLSRLARALGFGTYEALREAARAMVAAQGPGFGARAARLQAEAGAPSHLTRQAEACVANITALARTVDPGALTRAAECLRDARRVLLFGPFGSRGIVDYLAYLAAFFAPNWSLAEASGAALGPALGRLGTGDALLIVTKTPYARRAVLAADMAQAQGASTLVITDSHASPALAHATFSFLVPSESPQFFSSYAATLVLLEALISTIIAGSSRDISERIRDAETKNHSLGEFWADPPTGSQGRGPRP